MSPRVQEIGVCQNKTKQRENHMQFSQLSHTGIFTLLSLTIWIQMLIFQPFHQICSFLVLLDKAKYSYYPTKYARQKSNIICKYPILQPQYLVYQQVLRTLPPKDILSPSIAFYLCSSSWFIISSGFFTSIPNCSGHFHFVYLQSFLYAKNKAIF